ncbi:Amidohydrolase AmhX [Leucobacter sp. 7(1)]|uniref:amidohydrolase n=1 Tax=Leucobacter sp. 7(1) TaxID=1255613 RepID=UPI00097EF09A|nr:amidohydrolase [Leucobacter sp. 7(1)]SJN10210.1 Amidohydrolase AmhX [Leucobacter sp. 7(1)]
MITPIAEVSRILEIRAHLAANPEPSWREHGTAAYLAAVLREAGLDPKPFADFPGFTVDVGPGTPVIGLRGDLDALAHETPAGTVLAHSCGHDANLAIVTETVLRLAELGDRLPHGVRAIFQPAEEQGNGAASVAALGVADELDMLFGVHLRPGSELPAPRFAPAISHGACCFVRGQITGSDHHGARPHQGVNAIEVASEFAGMVAALRVDPQVPASAKFTELRAGSGNLNVIPGSASFGIDLRAQDNAAMTRLREGVAQIGRALALRYGVKITLAEEDHVPAAIVGDAAEAALAAAITRVAGAAALAPRAVTSGSDDFHCYTLHRPALQAAMLGVGADVTPGLHDPAMRYDLARLAPAAEVLVAACRAPR